MMTVEKIEEVMEKIDALDNAISKKYGLKDRELNLEDFVRDPDFYETFYCNHISFEATHLGVTGKVPDRLCRQYRRHGEMLIEMMADVFKDPANKEDIFQVWYEANYSDMLSLFTEIAAL